VPALIIGGVPVQQLDGALIWQARLDADGAPTAYAPPSSGLPLDLLANTGGTRHEGERSLISSALSGAQVKLERTGELISLEPR
jgi:hypothetical protein